MHHRTRETSVLRNNRSARRNLPLRGFNFGRSNQDMPRLNFFVVSKRPWQLIKTLKTKLCLPRLTQLTVSMVHYMVGISIFSFQNVQGSHYWGIRLQLTESSMNN